MSVEENKKLLGPNFNKNDDIRGFPSRNTGRSRKEKIVVSCQSRSPIVDRVYPSMSRVDKEVYKRIYKSWTPASNLKHPKPSCVLIN